MTGNTVLERDQSRESSEEAALEGARKSICPLLQPLASLFPLE
jgi:hypothetical protein